MAMSNLASTCCVLGRLQEALKLPNEVQQEGDLPKTLRAQDPSRAELTCCNLSYVYAQIGDFAQAYELMHQDAFRFILVGRLLAR